MEKTELYLSLGSNMGDRKKNISDAIALLDRELPFPHTALSEIIETPSWGFEGNDFLNCAVRYEIPSAGQAPDLHAHAILKLCKTIENSLGRIHKVEFDGKGRRIWHNRPIDIDILFYGHETIMTDDLVIPHPLMAERDFVTVPLRQIATPAIMEAFPMIFSPK